MTKAGIAQRSKYWFDNTMSRGTPALIGWLTAVSLLLVAVVTITWLILGTGKPTTPGALLWGNLVKTFKLGVPEKGTITDIALLLVLALGGIFITSMLIGLLTSGLNRKITSLRKGRSLVVESGHSVILGWSDQVFTVVSELVEANRSRRRAAVVILADKDKVEMEDAVRDRVGKTHSTRVVCRTGSPIDPNDLKLVSPSESRSVIVLSPPNTDDDDADAAITKTLLAITSDHGHRRTPFHIVAAVRNTRNLPVARLAGGEEAVLVDADDITARLIVQTARQPGLSAVYTHILAYAGSELYVVEEPKLTFNTFGDCQHAYRDSCLLGLTRPDGTPLINPPADTKIEPGDKVIMLAEDDSTIKLTDHPVPYLDDAIVISEPEPPLPERSLLLGWNRRAPSVIRELDSYVAAGSVVNVVTQREDAAPALADLNSVLRNVMVNVKEDDSRDRRTLEGLGIGQFSNIIVLCDDQLPPLEADSRALATLLHLRDITSRDGDGQQYSITSEMRDDRDRKIAQVTKADDFVVSEKLISLLMTQISESQHLAAVFSDLFKAEGSEIYLRPAAQYVQVGREVNFATIVESARRRNEVAMGYRIVNQKGSGVVVNPDKATAVTFTPDDRIIVLAED